MNKHRTSLLRVTCTVFFLLISSFVFANNFTSPTNGGYNIYWNLGYLTTVKNRTDFKMQVDGRYQVVAFDQSATRFSSQFDDNVDVNYKVGATPSSTGSEGGLIIKVVSITCKDVGPGESCSASCRLPGDFHVATGGACAPSDIVEADAYASPFAYSCTVPTFSGEVTTQVYCLDRRVR